MQKIAIIGGGASGLVTAWLLDQSYDITLYESRGYLGGHADTADINIDGVIVKVDLGVDFFNHRYYPCFYNLLSYLKIPLNSFTITTSFYQSNFKKLITFPPYYDKKIAWNSLTPFNLYYLIQLGIFIIHGRKLIAQQDKKITLEHFIEKMQIANRFKTEFLYPLLAAFWGVSINQIHNFSAFNAVQYIVNNYDLKDCLWHDIKNGFKTYIESIRSDLCTVNLKLNTQVKDIGKINNKYIIHSNDAAEEYDHLIFATGANITNLLLNNLTEIKNDFACIANIKYFDTKIIIHTDQKVMPIKKDLWRVINIYYNGTNSTMTVYKKWVSQIPLFKTWITNDVFPSMISPQNTYLTTHYQHPVVDYNYFEAQKNMQMLQGKHNLWFAGNWTTGNDSHESAIVSAMNITKQLTPKSERLKILKNNS